MQDRLTACMRRVVLAPLLLLLLATPASAQSARIKNLDLCNGKGGPSPEARITGCTALIISEDDTPRFLATVYNNRGNAYVAKGEHDRAIQDYDQAIKLHPNSHRTFNNRGVAYRKKGDYEQAIKDFAEAIRQHPTYASAFANRAYTYEKKGEYALAAWDYGEAIRLELSSHAVWNGRCWTRAIIGELQDALTDCNRALELNKNAATYDSRGLVHLKMNRLDAAIADYTSALQSEPGLASALYGRGLARSKKGDRAAADADLAAAKAIDASMAELFAAYGVR